MTHSIDEAIFLADRVAVMTARPGKIKKIIDINLPRPRTDEIRNSTAFAKIRHEAWELLKDEVLLAQDPSIRTITASLLEEQEKGKKRGEKHEKVG